MCIPEPADMPFPARLCHYLSIYLRIDENFDFSTLIGMAQVSMTAFFRGESNSRSSSPSFIAISPSVMANRGGIGPPSLLNATQRTNLS
mmetsp:Transcript_35145/g.41938  ORF Transcript_35145/g.41938 Transcript_35145/m.41938 type:complete len:89 (+) Transcript_35145:401-667(+)